MRACFNTKALRDAVSVVGAIVVKNSPKQAMACIRLSIGESCNVAATDSEVSIVRAVKASSHEGIGDTLFPQDRLSAILREVTGDEIEISIVEQIASIKCGQARFKVPTYVADDFPQSPKFDSAEYFSVSAGDMRKVVERCVFFDPKSNAPAMTGIMFDLEADKFFGVSLEKRCLSVVACNVMRHGGVKDSKSCLPDKAMRLIGSLLEGESSVDVCVLPNSVLLRTSTSVVSTQQIGVRVFTDWRAAYAAKMPVEIPIIPAVLLGALRQASITTVAESARLEFVFGEKMLKIKSAATVAGESEVEIPISSDFTGTIALIPDILMKAVKLSESPTAVLSLPDADGPVRIVSECGLHYTQSTCEVG